MRDQRGWRRARAAAPIRLPAEHGGGQGGGAQRAHEAPDRDATLDSALAAVDAAPTGGLARRWPLPLPSRRSKLGAYGRLLEELLEEEPGGGARFENDASGALRRRFLLVILRQLRAKKGVWALETEARQRRANGERMDEMLRRTPPNLETPTYTVLKSAASLPYEIRQYDEFAVCSTVRERAVSADGPKISMPSMPAAGGFQALAGYIFGGNSASEKMAMTTPVLSTPPSADGAVPGSMSFVLPSRYWGVGASDGPPAPLDAGVAIASKGGGALEASDTLAALWFGGFAGKEEVARRKERLLSCVAADPEWEAAQGAEAEPLLLQYNDPFTPPWARRNEVALPVRRVE